MILATAVLVGVAFFANQPICDLLQIIISNALLSLYRQGGLKIVMFDLSKVANTVDILVLNILATVKILR